MGERHASWVIPRRIPVHMSRMLTSYGLSVGLVKPSPQSMLSRGHAICVNAEMEWGTAGQPRAPMPQSDLALHRLQAQLGSQACNRRLVLAEGQGSGRRPTCTQASIPDDRAASFGGDTSADKAMGECCAQRVSWGPAAPRQHAALRCWQQNGRAAIAGAETVE